MNRRGLALVICPLLAIVAACAQTKPPAQPCQGSKPATAACSVQSPWVMAANPRFVAAAEHGRLEMIGEGDEQIRLLFVWGDPEDRGEAHGELLHEEVSNHTGRLIRLMTQDMKVPVEELDKVFEATRRHTPQYFMEELEGLANGAGLPLQEVVRANLIGERSEWHCSLFGAWGKATAADGHVYQLRALDYAVRAEIQQYPTIVVHVPDKGHPFANIGWAGIVGAVSGISSARIALSEIGDDYDEKNDTFDGMPFVYMLRDILQFDESLDAAIERVRRTPRTSSLMYGIGDGEYGQVRALQTSRTLCNVYNPDNLEPLLPTHPRIPDIVYWGMSWNVPQFDKPLHDKLKEHYGKINAKVTIEDILPSVKTGNLQAVVYDLTDMRIWVANARAKGEAGPLNAYSRPFVEIDMKEVFDRAVKLSKAAKP